MLQQFAPKVIGEIMHTAPVYKGTFKRLFFIMNMTVDKNGVLAYDEKVVDETAVKALVTALVERGFPYKDEYQR